MPISSELDNLFSNIYKRLRMISKGKALMTLTVKTINGNPIANLPIAGIMEEDNSSAKTDKNGVAVGYVNNGSVTLSIADYADILDKSKTYSFTQGEAYSDEWVITTRSFLSLTATKKIKFSTNCKTIDYTLAGGGGGGVMGSGGWTALGGGGGGGGYAAIATNVTPNFDTEYNVSVGAGGAQAQKGGTSSFMGKSASGGNSGSSSSTTPGTGNGNGGRGGYGAVGLPGAAGDGILYTSFTESVAVGGGGGGGGGYSNDTYVGYSGGAGGSPNGGHGGSGSDSFGGSGGSGRFPGGGAGGSGGGYKGTSDGSSGGNGGVAIRMHLTVN